MKKAAEIRSLFLSYFKDKDHTIVESSSLVPQNDPTLLFTNAGMVQFKDAFLGNEKKPYKRATSSQKCVRAGGKHNDLENVGHTARHHTFFEMLGNFSFGDYFKSEAIAYAWEFITQELKLPKEKLYITVHTDDDEAAEIWHKQEGIPKEKISRFDKDNFWQMADTGPCGPCSEIFVDRGEKYSCGKKSCAVGCECDRYMEFWNLVFMQFNKDENGKMTPLPKPSVDTGMGLERIALILQEVETNYETDLFQSIFNEIGKLTQVRYDPKNKEVFSFRVIADHIRACTFLMSDGVLPSNEGRGYVLRRIIRRAIRYGKNLGLNKPFLFDLSQFVIEQMNEAYPDLEEKKEFIQKALYAEEEQFYKTLEKGLLLLEEEIQKLSLKSSLSGEIAFKLYDTYGFPCDLTKTICQEKGLTVDEEAFERCMDKQRSESRKHWKGSGEGAVDNTYLKITNELKSKNLIPEFTGYTSQEETSECLAILTRKNDKLTNVNNYKTKPDDEIELIFKKTPFYGESGGQAGDQGKVFSPSGFEAMVTDVQRPKDELIVAHVKPTQGEIKVGDQITQQTDKKLRALTAKNHTATHILHWALREVLGKHVKQAGSLVNSEHLRFDFTHFQAVTPEELQKIESMINEKIWSSQPVSKKEMDKNEATKAGAIAFFGEKYGDTVRVVKVGDFSTELCGGTHIDQSDEIHLFKIAQEMSIASGVRRIVAYTSEKAFQYLNEKELETKQVRDTLKASSTKGVLDKIQKLNANEKNLKKEIEKLKSKTAINEIDELLNNKKDIHGTPFLGTTCQPDASGIKHLRELSDRLKQKEPQAVILLAMNNVEKQTVHLLAAVGPDGPKKVHAGKLIQELAPIIGGKGGGKPDLAQAGGRDSSRLDKVFAQAEKIISKHLS